jgi:glycosyltransferase involved in cell wall biosynthesis
MSDVNLTHNGRPSVTFALVAYKQERYVAEAISAAFAQTYTPLEIILSDDCSTDKTFEIMQQMAAVYEGPHRVVLNRNPENLNIGAHVNKVGHLASGELIVLAAGDDVSVADRTMKIVAKWEEINRGTAVICSDFEAINEESRRVELHAEATYRGPYSLDDMARGDVHVLGATSAMTKDVFTSFPDMDSSVRHEDRVLPFRALLLGGQVSLVDKKLVRYRVSGGISRDKPKSAKYAPLASLRTLPDARQRLADLYAIDCLNQSLRRECLTTILDHQVRIDLPGLKGMKLEIGLVQWMWRGARLSPLFKHYVKLRFLWLFSLHFERHYEHSAE